MKQTPCLIGQGAVGTSFASLKIKNQTTAITLKDMTVEVITGDDRRVRVAIDQIVTESELQDIVDAIKQGVSTFSNAKIDAAINTLGIKKRKGTSYEKADITIDFQDKLLNTDQGISIKSFLGNPPTLLNASGATNFVYTVSGLKPTSIKKIKKKCSRAIQDK